MPVLGRCAAALAVCLLLAAPALATVASGGGDPWFNGFDGSAFEFQGQPDKSYNIFSERTHQLNAFFVAAPEGAEDGAPQEQPGNAMMTMGFQYLTTNKVTISTIEYRKLIVTVGDEEVAASLEGNRRTMDGSMYLTVHDRTNEAPYESQVVVLTTPQFEFEIWSPPSWGNPFKYKGVNLVMRITVLQLPAGEVHGILGQTLTKSLAVAAANPGSTLVAAQAAPPTRFSGEGADADYEVSHLFADDCTFNKFRPQEPLPLTQVALQASYGGRKALNQARQHFQSWLDPLLVSLGLQHS